MRSSQPVLAAVITFRGNENLLDCLSRLRLSRKRCVTTLNYRRSSGRQVPWPEDEAGVSDARHWWNIHRGSNLSGGVDFKSRIIEAEISENWSFRLKTDRKFITWKISTAASVSLEMPTKYLELIPKLFESAGSIFFVNSSSRYSGHFREQDFIIHNEEENERRRDSVFMPLYLSLFK